MKPGNMIEDWVNKVHDNLCEPLFKQTRRKISYQNGLTRLNKNEADPLKNFQQKLQEFVDEDDYINNNTDNSPTSFVYSVLHHINKYYARYCVFVIICLNLFIVFILFKLYCI